MGRPTVRLGMDGYARLLALLAKPMTRDQFQEAGVIGRLAATRFLGACHATQRARILSWLTPYRQSPVPVWQRGAGPDAPPPSSRPTGRPVQGPPQAGRGAEHVPEELAKFFLLLDALSTPLTPLEVEDRTGINERTVRKTIDALHDTQQCHIVDWKHREADDTGPWMPMFVLGAGQDAPKPADKPRSITNRTYYLRRKYGAPDARVEIIPREAGRYEVTTVPAFFSALAIGSYLPADTAISRAYGRP